MRKVYPFTRLFILDQRTVMYKEIEHCFQLCCSLHGDLTRCVLFSCHQNVSAYSKHIFITFKV
jgi:hypothetical protein